MKKPNYEILLSVLLREQQKAPPNLGGALNDYETSESRQLWGKL
jgi:hypothetical protein